MLKYIAHITIVMVHCGYLQKLINDGYVDGSQVYPQNFTVISTLQPDLIYCRYCMSCGSPLISHDHSKCDAMETMRRRETLNQQNDLFLFNLELTSTKQKRKPGTEYPDTFGMRYCPYCGERYEFEPNPSVT